MIDLALEDKVAVVTGGRRGIGRSIALALAGQGVDVVVCDAVDHDGLLGAVVEEIRTMGRRSLGHKADVSRRSEVDGLVETTISSFAHIDILVNCAGVWTPGQSLIGCSEETWDQVIDTNLKGTFFCCASAAAEMVKRKAGSIINLSSQAGLNPGRNVGAYSISKAAIIMLTRQLALELADQGIRVNALAPGIVKTDFNRGVWSDPTVASRTSAMIPLGRLAGPDEIAWPALFLASDVSSYVTGAVINIDGGWQVPVSDRVAAPAESA